MQCHSLGRCLSYLLRGVAHANLTRHYLLIVNQTTSINITTNQLDVVHHSIDRMNLAHEGCDVQASQA